MNCDKCRDTGIIVTDESGDLQFPPCDRCQGDRAFAHPTQPAGTHRIPVSDGPLADVAREMAEAMRDALDLLNPGGQTAPFPAMASERLRNALHDYDALTRTIPGDAAETR